MTGKRHAILVASSDFPEDATLTPLRCPVQDIESFGDILKADNHGAFDEVHLMKNEPHYKILEKVNRVIKNADREDMVVFFYSGHGKLDGAGRLYLATSNTNVEVLEATSVPVSQIKDYFDVSAAQQLAIILDCCYSGAIEKSFTKGTVDDQLNLMSGGKGTYVLTASTGLQTAKENEGDDQSVFTKHLINGILSGDADTDHNGVITLNELYKYTYREVQKDSHQKPMKWDLNVEGELIVARSGKSHWKERRDKVHEKLLAMGVERTIPNSILTAALSLSEKSPSDVQTHEKAGYDLLSQFAEEDMRSGGFIEAWLNAKEEPKAEPTPKVAPKVESEPLFKPEPVQAPYVPPTNAAVQSDNTAVADKDATKENLLCFAVAIGGFFLMGFFITSVGEFADYETLLGAMIMGIVAASAALIFTYKKRSKHLPLSAKIHYWGWGIIYFFTFLGALGQ